MIKIQQEVVRTVQNVLLAEKQKLATQKPEKPTNARSKPAKPKASGSQGKKAGGATPATKKSGGAKKVSKTNRVITEAEKAAIANAINDLDMPHIEHAIGIIKKDTNQTVSVAEALRCGGRADDAF
jgi:bromodomain-containing factor 1